MNTGYRKLWGEVDMLAKSRIGKVNRRLIPPHNLHAPIHPLLTEKIPNHREVQSMQLPPSIPSMLILYFDDNNLALLCVYQQPVRLAPPSLPAVEIPKPDIIYIIPAISPHKFLVHLLLIPYPGRPSPANSCPFPRLKWPRRHQFRRVDLLRRVEPTRRAGK